MTRAPPSRRSARATRRRLPSTCRGAVSPRRLGRGDAPPTPASQVQRLKHIHKALESRLDALHTVARDLDQAVALVDLDEPPPRDLDRRRPEPQAPKLPTRKLDARGGPGDADYELVPLRKALTDQAHNISRDESKAGGKEEP